MAFRKQQFVIFGILVIFTTLVHAGDLRNRINDIEKVRSSQETDIDNLRADLTLKTTEIERTKKGTGTGIVSKLVLQKKLREAQTVSKDLENLVKKHAQLTQELRKERSKLLREIDIQIQTLSADKSTRKLPELQQLQKLIGEKDQLLALQQKELLEIPEFNLSSPQNDREDLIEKLQVVEDLKKNMEQKIAFLKDEISEERSKEFLRNEVAHFIDEENFFGEQSFISNGLNRKDSGKNLSALALKKEAAADNNNIPATTPTTPTQPASAPTTNPSTTTPTTDPATTTPTVQVSSESTSFQQPQDSSMFETLLDQVQESIRDTNPKQNTKNKNEPIVVAKAQKPTKKYKQNSKEQNLAISEKILNDLNILRQNLNQKIQELE